MNIISYLNINNNSYSQPKSLNKKPLGSFLLTSTLNHDVISFKRQWKNKETGANRFSNVDIILNNYFDNKKSFVDRLSTLSEYDLKHKTQAKKEELERWSRLKPFLKDLTPQNIDENIKKNYFSLVNIGLGLHIGAIPEHVKWLGFQDEQYQKASCVGVNDARTERVNEYLALISNDFPINENYSDITKEYLNKLKNSYSYKILTLLLAFHDISIANRKIPLILDVEALAKTFKEIETNRRDYSIKNLSKIYHNNIIINELNKNKNLVVFPKTEDTNNIKNLKECWIKIDGRKKKDEKQSQLIRLVEIFSNKNWCTHSSHDKAKDQVETGDFFVCIKKDSDGCWSPITAISTCKTKRHKAKIIELQGIQNNYILSDEDYNRIKIFLKAFRSELYIGENEINNGTPTAEEQIKCSQYLKSQKTSPLKNAILEALKNKNTKDYTLKYKRNLQLLKEMNCNPKELPLEYFNNKISFALDDIDFNNIKKYEIKTNENKVFKIENPSFVLPKPITIKTSNSITIPTNIELSKKLNIEDINFLHLDKYNPMIKVSNNSFVKLSYLGIDEDSLLSNVAQINTFYLNNTSIKEFPENLDFVNILYCTKEQKKRFKKNIDELKILNPNLKIIETK